jgi:hypothetical protein
MKSKFLWATVILLIGIRVALPGIILRQLNEFLGGFSSDYSIHIDDLDLGLLRGAYRFQGITAQLKKKNETFFKGDLVDVSLAWRELFHGRVFADAIGERLELNFTPGLKEALMSQPQKAKSEAAQVKKKLFPFRIGRIDIRNSTFQYEDLPGLPEIERWKVTDVGGRLSNVLPTEANPIMLFSAQGTLLGSSTIKAVGHLDKFTKPPRWDVDVVMREFDLVKANPLLKRKVPVTFTAGHLDLYVEAKSEKGRIEGSVKPFFKKVDVIEKGEHFMGLKHFGIELTTAAANLILRRAKDHTVATKILFAYENGHFQLNSAKALSEAIAHGFEDKVNPGTENEFKLSTVEMTRKSIE